VGIKFKSKKAMDAYLDRLTRPQKRPPSPVKGEQQKDTPAR
jgi:hypothetical protein